MNSSISDYYDRAVDAEWKRLDHHWLEFETTYRHIVQCIPVSAPILDLGGGPGRYAFRLTQGGYSVFLGDLSERNIAFARVQEQASGVRLAGAARVDARDLGRFADASFGATLCLGPFYHLQDPADRRQVVRELHRVTRPGGFVFAAFITPYAPLYDFIKNAPQTIGVQRRNLRRWLATGLYSPPEGSRRFPHAYFARPNDIAAEFPADAFEPQFLFGCEGIFNQSEERLKAMDADTRQQWLDMGFELSCSSMAIASSEHVVFVGKRRP
jgi:S-adenosylmethionine-dependent methyltransferase